MYDYLVILHFFNFLFQEGLDILVVLDILEVLDALEILEVLGALEILEILDILEMVGWGCHPLMRFMNSSLVFACLKAPLNALVVVMEFCFSTPLICMHM